MFHHMMMSDTKIFPRLKSKICRLTWEIKKGLQVLLGFESTILKRNAEKIWFDKNMINTGGTGFLLINMFNRTPRNAYHR